MAFVNIFTYGTLCVADVMHAVTGKKFKTEKASLSGFARYLVKDHVFPAIIPADNINMVDGITYFDIDEESLNLIDQFESDFYDRTLLEVTNESKQSYQAYAYVLNPSYGDFLSDIRWNETLFRQQHLNNYLRRIISNLG